jgi:anti-anti-sigma factor
MIVAHSLNTPGGDLPCRADHHLTAGRGVVDMLAQLRHLATILTISGDIDATNTDRVSSYATRLVPVGNALLLDLSGVTFFAAQSISVLVTVDDACDDAESPWALVTSHAVDRVLRISEHDDILPVASSVLDGMQYFADLARVRQQVPSPTRRPSAPGATGLAQVPSVMSYLPSRRDQPTGPTDVDLSDISQPTSRLPQR